MTTTTSTFTIEAAHDACHLYHLGDRLFQRGDTLTIDPNRVPVVWDFIYARLVADGRTVVRQYMLGMDTGHQNRSGLGFQTELLGPEALEDDQGNFVDDGETYFGITEHQNEREFEILGVVTSVIREGVETPCGPAVYPRLYQRAIH